MRLKFNMLERYSFFNLNSKVAYMYESNSSIEFVHWMKLKQLQNWNSFISWIHTNLFRIIDRHIRRFPLNAIEITRACRFCISSGKKMLRTNHFCNADNHFHHQLFPNDSVTIFFRRLWNWKTGHTKFGKISFGRIPPYAKVEKLYRYKAKWINRISNFVNRSTLLALSYRNNVLNIIFTLTFRAPRQANKSRYLLHVYKSVIKFTHVSIFSHLSSTPQTHHMKCQKRHCHW